MFFALLHNPVQTLSATLQGSYGVALAWGASPTPGITGYRVYYGAASGNYSNSVVVGNATTNMVPGLVSGVTYFFAVTAYNASGLEGTFSNEISFVPGLSTVRIHVTANGQAVLTVQGLIGHIYDIQVTPGFKTWTIIGSVTVGASGSLDFTDMNAARFSRRFYRTRG